MDILIACESSGIVREAFRRKGHDAWSNDFLPSDDSSPHHIAGNCVDVIMKTKWDLIIMHPPCTALAVSGNSTYGKGMPKENERKEAVRWTKELWNLAKVSAPKVALENPVGVLNSIGKLGKPQYVQPYWFGHMEQKKTGLWLHNLPKLEKTNDVYEEMMKLPKRKRERLHYLSPSKDRWKVRSQTYRGLAEAMAEQWG